MHDDVLIKTESLSRRYGSLRAVEQIGFELRRGEILGFLGPNGAGKSTSMQMICGCLAPSAGRIEINGIDLLREPTEAKRHLGYLPEIPPLYPELRVADYLRFCARLRRLPRARSGQAVERVLEACGLGDCADRLIGQLSKGMQQRVGIAQALVHEPAVVVLDEPGVGLDPIQIREIRTLITAIGRERAVLLSSHILPEVEAVCSRVLILHQGRIAYDARLGQDDACWLRLGLGNPPPADTLAALDFVREVRTETDGGWLLRVRPGADATARLLQMAVDNGWRPDYCAPRRSDLEQVFVALTTGDGGPGIAESAA